MGQTRRAGRIRTVAARAEESVARLARERWDAVVLDPPREGCAPTVLSAVFDGMRPERVVYVSCNPEVLARDLATIVKSGYRIDRVQAVDMFPHTDHIETVISLRCG